MTSLIGVLLFAALRGSVACGLTLLAAAAMPKASPALRHVILLAGLVSFLLMPVGGILLPTLDVPVPRQLSLVAAGAGASQPRTLVRTAGVAEAPRSPEAPPAMEQSPSQATAQRQPGLSSTRIALLVIGLLWAGVSLALASRCVAGRVVLRRLLSLAAPLEGPPAELAARLAVARRVKIVRFLYSSRCEVPITFGAARPIVMVPARLLAGPPEDFRMALAHELGHVARQDVLAGLFAYLICCLFWFVPVTWLALARLRVEQEKACDQLAATVGPSRSGYAGLLLRLHAAAQGAEAPHLLSASAGNSHGLEERIRAILAPGGRRHIVSGKRLWAVVAVAAAAIGCLSMTRCTAAATPGTAVAFERATPAMWPLAGIPAGSTGAVRSFGLFRYTMERAGSIPVGVDIAAPAGTVVIATARGTVEDTGRTEADGWYVSFKTADSWWVLLASLDSAPSVRVGEELQAGQAVGHVGVTPSLPSPHVHYRAYVRGSPALSTSDGLTVSKAKAAPAPSAAHAPVLWPLAGVGSAVGKNVTQLYGFSVDPFHGLLTFHQGIDIAAPEGTPVVATISGYVAEAGSDETSGTSILITQEPEDTPLWLAFSAFYSHLAKSSVHPGQQVRAGDVIGFVGSTGRVTGPHLHYEVLYDAGSLDPLHPTADRVLEVGGVK